MPGLVANQMTLKAEHVLEFPLESIKALLLPMNAAEVAELFLSPFVHSKALVEATAEEGPSLWIVNRSDVYDQTLSSLTQHSVLAISARAKEKLGLRQSKLIFLSPPELPESLEETPDYMIEDLLGHPLVPLQIPLYFSHHLLEDFRSSAALSLTRRLLEHPPNWNYDLSLKSKMLDNFFQLLLNDPSPMVRSYIARIPIFETTQIGEAIQKEQNDFVRGRLLQNPASSADFLHTLAGNFAADLSRESLFLARVVALDQRLPQDLRKNLITKQIDRNPDLLTLGIHSYYLKI